MKVKFKTCSKCGKSRPIFSKTLCKGCWARQYKPPKTPKKVKIKYISKSGYQRNLAYKKARIKFLESKDHCEVALPGCLYPYPVIDKSGLQVHHMRGREGDLLTNEKYFLCVCAICHRFLEDNPKIAKENGWSHSRLNKEANEE